MRALRKLLSIVLLTMLGMPFVSPVFALSAADGGLLPACCRRNGMHHCTMMMAGQKMSSERTATWKAPQERCPYCPLNLTFSHGELFTLPTARSIHASLTAHPAGIVQTECRRRIARDRSRQKRGPPSLFL